MQAVLEEQRVRITTRVPAQLHNTLAEAAELTGATLNQFVVQSAFQEAQRILERETTIRLSREDARMVFSLLEHPPKANKFLKGAIKEFKKTVRV